MTICTDWFDAADLDCDAADLAATAVDFLVDVAQEWMYAATGSQFSGECEATLRPVLPCACTWRCDCGWRRIDLSVWVPAPITLVEVVVDGVVDTDWQIVNDRFLMPLNDRDWPVQDLDVTTGDGVWTVEVTYGEAPPNPVLWAGKELACQLVRKATTGECDLPDNATSVSDNGVTISLDVPEGGRFGIPLIDAALDLFGGAGRRQRRRMHDPLTGVALRV